MEDFLFRGSLAELDPAVYELTQFEAERQNRRLIMIPSESSVPLGVREALQSAFHDIYAEGYPDEETRWMTEEKILDYPVRLAHYRRYSDPRYYKGVEYANLIEALARRRCAETFAANNVTADDLYVNVQALSGAPANNAVYHALIQPEDTILGMDLLHGGHLTHGSSVNRSGKLYSAVHYAVDSETERIDYTTIDNLAQQHHPKIVIAGYSSYPWQVDWKRFREIADGVGAFLFADISHVAGLVAAGVYPSPVGIADVVTFTTHKTMSGPRGACILTTNPMLARKIDRAVFPGEQGGPHLNVIAALAVAFKLAQRDRFRRLQSQIVENCIAFTERFQQRGFRIPFGGTDTHLMNLDCKSIQGPDGATLSGDLAARILDIAGVVTNRNTIPGDLSAANPSGIRMGTSWITQRGFKKENVIQLADIISDVLQATKPYFQSGKTHPVQRAKVDFEELEQAKIRIRDLADEAGFSVDPSHRGYPHFYFLDDLPTARNDTVDFSLGGERVRQFLNFTISADVEALQPGHSQLAQLDTPRGVIDICLTQDAPYEFRLSAPSSNAGLVAAWLRALSDGYVYFDTDLFRKIPGPVTVTEAATQITWANANETVNGDKPYYIGIPEQIPEPAEILPTFTWEENEKQLQRTPLYDVHCEMGAKIVPFAGWEMPVWYSSVKDEHLAVRQAAGLFDVSHMGVYQAEGPDSVAFLDSVCGNDIGSLKIGESLYTHFLDPDANVIDDLLVYRVGFEQYLIVVNASNDDKNWTWLNAVRTGKVRVDTRRPWAKAYGRNIRLRNLRDSQEGSDMRVDLALQGPHAREVLLALGCDDPTHKRIQKLKRTQITQAIIGGVDLIVSRTGYTGARIGFELFVHPEESVYLWNKLISIGEPWGLKPIGLGARDSLRTEAGLPLYGQEMSGKLGLGVGEAGFGSYVKTYKPWFVGRDAFIARESSRTGEIIRFRFNEKGVRMAHTGDPVLDKRGRMIGSVTSCAVDSDGFLTGQAYLNRKFKDIGTPIYIYQSAKSTQDKPPAELREGDRANIPTAAMVISRFGRW